MGTASLREVRLTSFKSFKRQVLPIDAITVLTGLNSSGKSNALDAIEVLARLAGGEDLTDALDSRHRESGPIRGGSRGCAPHGTNSFALGCTVEHAGELIELDIEIQVEPELRVIRENLRGPGGGGPDRRDLVATKHVPELDTWVAEVTFGSTGAIKDFEYRDARLLTPELSKRPPAGYENRSPVTSPAAAVTQALRGVFHLDPIPHLMRDYAAERSWDLRRTGENLSAALSRIERVEPRTFERLVELVRHVGGEGIDGIRVTRSELGDVMLALVEKFSGRREMTPAREMSDGLLRFIAIATALLTSNRGLDIDLLNTRALSDEATRTGVLLVVEELENGLHPSQSGRVLQLLQEVATTQSTQVLFTSHSPALLNELTGKLNTSVVVCYRDPTTGRTELTRLVELEGYAEAMAAGRLGDVVSTGRMVGPEPRQTNVTEFNRLLGIDG